MAFTKVLCTAFGNMQVRQGNRKRRLAVLRFHVMMSTILKLVAGNTTS